MSDLEGKSIVVVGAAGRIGRAVVDSILKAGGSVAAVDNVSVDFDWLVDSERQRFISIEGNITDTLSVRNALQFADGHFGRLDGAVNAAYPRSEKYGKDFLDVDYEGFCENLSLHLGGYFLFMQECVRYSLAKKDDFTLVNFSSVYGVRAPIFEIYEGTAMTMPVEYAAIKSALQHLVNYVSTYTKGSRFRVNCISPGGILAGQDERFISRYNSHCRIKGMLDVDDVVGAVVFLLSERSRFVCGQNIIVDDGFSL